MSDYLPGVTMELSPSSTPLHYVYAFTAEHGILDATFRPNPGDFCIANVDVDLEHRHRGIGKALVCSALEEAQRLDARSVYAALISRESIALMTSVFGEEAVTIGHLGTFTPKGYPVKRDADAVLLLKLK